MDAHQLRSKEEILQWYNVSETKSPFQHRQGVLRNAVFHGKTSWVDFMASDDFDSESLTDGKSTYELSHVDGISHG